MSEEETTVGVYLQIGAFSQRINAERLADQTNDFLIDKTRIRESLANGKKIYRVQIGPIANVDIADRIVNALLDIGVAEHHFVVQ